MTQIVSLSDAITLQRGFDLPTSQRKSGEYPVVTSTGMATTHDEYKVRGPGVVIGRSGSIGGGQYIDTDFWPLNTTLWVKDFKGNNEKFIYYLLRSLDFSSFNAGAAVPTLNRNHLSSLKVRIPTRDEQDEIADTLGTIDEKIELNRKMNETLEQMGQALFRHYFIDNPEAEKWEAKTIGKLCDVKTGRTPPRKESAWFDKTSGEVWVSIKDMGRGMTFIADSSEYLTEDAATRFNIPAIDPGTLLLSFKLTVGRLCISTKKMYSNEAIAQLPIKSSEISVEYLYYFLRNFNYTQLSSTSSIATAVNSATVKNIKVVVPSTHTLKEFTLKSHNILEAVKNNETEIQNLTTLRDTLLPRLINGKMKIGE